MGQNSSSRTEALLGRPPGEEALLASLHEQGFLTAAVAAVGVPKSKLMRGIGGYAICYPSYITAARQRATICAIEGGDNNFPLGNVFASSGPLAQLPQSRNWDAVAQQPYLSLPTDTSISSCASRPTRYIPYDDEESLIAKGQWSRANGYGGTIVWNLQQLRLPAGAVGGRSPDALLQALKAGFLTA